MKLIKPIYNLFITTKDKEKFEIASHDVQALQIALTMHLYQGDNGFIRRMA
jgi:hypothetical protein